MVEVTKPCRKCGLNRPYSDFHRVKTNRDGLRNTCKTCWSGYAKSHYEANRVQILERHARNRARDPEREKRQAQERGARRRALFPDEEREKAQRWRSANRDRTRRASRAYYARNRARLRHDARVYQQMWRQVNRDLARIKDLSKRVRRRNARHSVLVLAFSAQQLAARMSMFPGCWICGGPKQTVDHVKPVSRGGAHALMNLRPACNSCNSSKRDTWPYVLKPKRQNL